MECRSLGKTGLRVSTLCFGTMSFGGTADEVTAAALYRRCREAGINLFDCANVYAGGRSEEILGPLIARERDAVVVTSKVGFSAGDGVNDRGLSRRHLRQSVERSLGRLRTDRLDVLFVHTYDPAVAMDELLRALDDLVRRGDVLYLGASNWAAWQIALALGKSAAEGWSRFSCIQPMYNLVKRQAEVELLPLAEAEGLGVLTYSPLGGGLLSGKYGVGRRPSAGRLVENQMYGARYGDSAYLGVADRLIELARTHGVHPAALAVAWVAAHPSVTAPIIGARTVEQLEGSLGAAEIEMTADLYQKISGLSPAPPPATDRSEERIGVRYGGVHERE